MQHAIDNAGIISTCLKYNLIRFLCLTGLLFLIACNDTFDVETPGTLVPPTADQDPDLPQVAITVAGHTRKVHLQTFGNPENPPVFVLHGGPGADFRLLLPLKSLADNFYVVMWDARGAGLSERVTKKELSFDSFDEEIIRIKETLSRDKQITLIGHSFGGQVMARYTARHPGDVKQLILIEPGKLDMAIDAHSNGGAVSFLDGQDFFWQNEIISSKDHASADYKAIELLPKTTRNWTCDKSIIDNYHFWRFGAFHYYIVQKNTYKLPHDFNWADGIENYHGPVTILTGTCGALSENFQKKTNLLTLPHAQLNVIQGANHISLFTDFSEQTVAAIREALKP